MQSDRNSVQVDLEMERPTWAQRKFLFGHPLWMLADFIERLRGVLPRLDDLLVGLNDDHAHRQFDGKWSIAQNIGHLSDVEELWQERLEDLRQGKKTYSAAVGARFQELAKRHQHRPVAETMNEFRERRSRLIDALVHASPELQRASAFHERLQVPMRLVDCAQFYAEHDDHHLIRIRTLKSMDTFP
ncbi:MAG TPA: DinB family protein [Gemmatimonadaceae bacterium]